MLTPSWIDDGSDIPDPLGCGERAVQWLHKLRHPKNPAPGHPFQLDPWQERIIRRLYGPRHPDGSRIVRRMTLVLPRGNRKTSLCAAITLLHLMGPERRPGNLIVSATSAHEQALELFNEAAMIVQHDSRLRRRADRDGVPYPDWAEQDSIVQTPVNVVDFRAVGLGLDHCEARFWHGWHRHISLVMAAAAFLAKLEADLRRLAWATASRKPNETSPARSAAA